MNIVDQVYMLLIYVWSEVDKVAMSAGLTAFVVAVLRMRKHGKVIISEALLCGVFACIAITAITFIGMMLGVPPDNIIAQGGGSLIAGAIGWYGTERTVGYVEDKMGGSKDVEEDH